MDEKISTWLEANPAENFLDQEDSEFGQVEIERYALRDGSTYLEFDTRWRLEFKGLLRQDGNQVDHFCDAMNLVFFSSPFNQREG